MKTVTRAAAIGALALCTWSITGLGSSATGPAIPVNNGQETTGAEGGAHGKFSYTVTGDQFCYSLNVTGLSANAVAAHIHLGTAGSPGPVQIPLTVPSATSFTATGCTTVSDPAILAGLASNPRGYYVNVHTPTYPGGEVRGQLK